jgi:hypothetical protein
MEKFEEKTEKIVYVILQNGKWGWKIVVSDVK